MAYTRGVEAVGSAPRVSSSSRTSSAPGFVRVQEFLASASMGLMPGVPAAFVGRMLDLTMRWSLNNTAKSFLWMATPRAQQDVAKPQVEGTIKKTGCLRREPPPWACWLATA